MLDKLTDATVRNAKPKAIAYKLTDGGGMYLLVTPKGQKWWRFDYRHAGKRNTVSLGVYPDVGLKDARAKRQTLRSTVAAGASPAAERKEAKATREDTLKGVAEEWLAKNRPTWAPKHIEKVEGRLAKYVYPWLGSKVLREISSADLLTVLQRVEATGAHETAHRVRQHVGQLYRYAIATGRTDSDISYPLRGALTPVQPKHFGAITEPKGIAALMRAIDGYSGQLVTRCALRLSALVFVRPGELRKAEWSEFDLDAAEWRIPAEKMKERRPHLVPLSRQAIEVLRELQPYTGSSRYVFPSVRSWQRAMSENTITAALRGLGYSGDQMTAHGFRAMASTRLNEMGWHRDAIERQLAHVEGNAVRAAYNHAEHLPERRQMMQAWADYLDSMRSVADVVAIRRVS